jgi:hypothetical protein
LQQTQKRHHANLSSPTRRAALIGFIGHGLIGSLQVFDFKNQKDADLAAMCDVYKPCVEQGVAACGHSASVLAHRKRLDAPSLSR